MEVQITYNDRSYKADLSKGINISNVLSNQNDLKAFHAPDVLIEPFKVEGFVGDIKQGSSVNFKNVFLNPHGNGTHTETIAHIQDIDYPIYKALEGKSHFMADLISIIPQVIEEDHMITKSTLIDLEAKNGEALILRVYNESIGSKDFSGTNPPYIHPEAMEYIVSLGYQHILIDLPSVDKEDDGGALASHKIFFKSSTGEYHNRTITEMIQIPITIQDGLYLLDIQVINLDLDASPSRIMLYELY